MIADAVRFITEDLNAFLEEKDPEYRGNEIAVMSEIVNLSGEASFDFSNSPINDIILVTLINIEEETVGKAQSHYYRRNDLSAAVVNPEIKLNLYLLFSAFSGVDDKSQYHNRLKLISLAVRFFQFKRVFNHENSPSLSDQIRKLTAELISPTFEQQNFIWNMLGTQYAPSVIYKIRMLTIRETEGAADAPLIRKVESSIGAQ